MPKPRSEKGERQLRAYWSKSERDIEFWYPDQKANGAYLHGCVFTKEFVREMDERGFDITTLDFKISKKERAEELDESEGTS